MQCIELLPPIGIGRVTLQAVLVLGEERLRESRFIGMCRLREALFRSAPMPACAVAIRAARSSRAATPSPRSFNMRMKSGSVVALSNKVT
ncbi:MAG TPA: hypothetical protein VN989_00675, partial [Casimicrobiaceae bacterium]|nr:hypothetical protein [Casimicrobiaceae bacterium]